MNTQNPKYTLITGASSGLGKEFAVQCAKAGRPVILVALPGSRTDILAASIRQAYGTDVQAFEFDLTDTRNLAGRLYDITMHFDIDYLINNAGMGGTSAMMETTPERIGQIIGLNISSTVMMTRLLIPHLLKHEKSYIMNVSSMAAFTPIAYKTVYPASKAFISSFSLGLREEFSGTGLSVSVVYPGPMMTNAQTSRRIIWQGQKAQIGLLSVPEIAAYALRKTMQRKPEIIPGVMNRINHLLMQLLPLEWKLRIVSNEVRKELQIAF